MLSFSFAPTRAFMCAVAAFHLLSCSLVLGKVLYVLEIHSPTILASPLVTRSFWKHPFLDSLFACLPFA